jgi:hypothetical protein
MIHEYIVKKKPFIQKAIQFTPELTDEELRKWSDNKAFITHLDRDDEPCVLIMTLEGAMKAYYGDYIMQGVNGNDFYPVKESIMIKSYDFLRD